MTNKRLPVPPDLDFLIEKREQERREQERRGTDSELEAECDSADDRRQSDRRRKKKEGRRTSHGNAAAGGGALCGATFSLDLARLSVVGRRGWCLVS